MSLAGRKGVCPALVLLPAIGVLRFVDAFLLAPVPAGTDGGAPVVELNEALSVPN